MKAVAAEARVAVAAKAEDVVRVAAEAKVAGAGLLPAPASSHGPSVAVAVREAVSGGPGEERRSSRSRHHQPVG